MPVLAHAAPERQRLLERQPNIVLPEGEHLLRVVREQPDIDVLFGEAQALRGGYFFTRICIGFAGALGFMPFFCCFCCFALFVFFGLLSPTCLSPSVRLRAVKLSQRAAPVRRSVRAEKSLA